MSIRGFLPAHLVYLHLLNRLSERTSHWGKSMSLRTLMVFLFSTALSAQQYTGFSVTSVYPYNDAGRLAHRGQGWGDLTRIDFKDGIVTDTSTLISSKLCGYATINLQGTRIAYFHRSRIDAPRQKLSIIDIDGSNAQVLAQVDGGHDNCISWPADGYIYFNDGPEIWRVHPDDPTDKQLVQDLGKAIRDSLGEDDSLFVNEWNMSASGGFLIMRGRSELPRRHRCIFNIWTQTLLTGNCRIDGLYGMGFSLSPTGGEAITLASGGYTSVTTLRLDHLGTDSVATDTSFRTPLVEVLPGWLEPDSLFWEDFSTDYNRYSVNSDQWIALCVHVREKQFGYNQILMNAALEEAIQTTRFHPAFEGDTALHARPGTAWIRPPADVEAGAIQARDGSWSVPVTGETRAHALQQSVPFHMAYARGAVHVHNPRGQRLTIRILQPNGRLISTTHTTNRFARAPVPKEVNKVLLVYIRTLGGQQITRKITVR